MLEEALEDQGSTQPAAEDLQGRSHPAVEPFVVAVDCERQQHQKSGFRNKYIKKCELWLILRPCIVRFNQILEILSMQYFATSSCRN